MKDIGADAKVVLSRGSVLTNADTEPVGGDTFGSQSYHNGDYALYYNNIKDNVAKRIAAFMESRWRQAHEAAAARFMTRAKPSRRQR